MNNNNDCATFEHVSAGTYRLIGAPNKASVLNTGSFKKSKLTEDELKELSKKTNLDNNYDDYPLGDY